MKFKASLDRLTVIVSALVILFIAGFLIWTLWFTPAMNLYGQISIGFGLVIIAGSFLLYPTGYFIDENGVAVKSILFSRSIPKSSIIDVFEITSEEMKATIRAFGSGGFFGYFGLFYNTKFKWMTWFCTQRKNYVMVQTDKRKFVFTPDNPQEFIAALK